MGFQPRAALDAPIPSSAFPSGYLNVSVSLVCSFHHDVPPDVSLPASPYLCTLFLSLRLVLTSSPNMVVRGVTLFNRHLHLKGLDRVPEPGSRDLDRSLAIRKPHRHDPGDRHPTSGQRISIPGRRSPVRLPIGPSCQAVPSFQGLQPP